MINVGVLEYDLRRIKGIDWRGREIYQQEEFVFAPEPHIGYFGGFDNGKTWSICLRGIFQSLKHPGNVGMLCRKTFPELRMTTRKQFFALFGCNESTIQKHPYVKRFSQTENMVRFINDSEVHFISMGDESAYEKILSFNGNWFAIDQAEEVSESAYLTLLSRIGRTNTGIPVWDALTGNPAGHDWIWKRYIQNRAEAERNGYRMIEATTYDNTFVRDGYIDTLKANYDDTRIQRFIYGNWDSFAGQVYNEFDTNVHVIESFDIPDAWKAGIGMDLGYNNPTAVLWFAVDWDGNLHIYDEHVAREMIPEEHAAAMKMIGIERENGKQLPIYAPHDAMNRGGISRINHQQAYAKAGVFIQSGNRMNPTVRINQMKKWLKVRDGLHPYKAGMNRTSRIFVHDCCINTIDEFGLYRWKELKPGQESDRSVPEEVVKLNDHCMDAAGEFILGWGAGHKPQRKKEKTIEELDIEAFISDARPTRDWKYT